MVGIAAFTVPSPDFGPAILAAPLWALALLHYWRAVGEGERGYWFLLALDLGLLLLASYVGLILLALLLVFTLAQRARARARCSIPSRGSRCCRSLIVIFPHLAWLKGARDLVIAGLNDSASRPARCRPAVWLCIALVLTHLGLGLLVAFASGWPRRRHERAPLIDRNPVEPFARLFVYFFALMPAASAIAIVFASGRLGPLERVAPLVVLSGLAVVVAAGDRVPLYRERMVSSTWLGLLVAPPVLIVLGIGLLPWTFAVDLKVSQPANAEGALFRRQFPAPHRQAARLTSPAMPQLAPLVALGAPSRPHVYFDWAPQRSPWASPADFRKRRRPAGLAGRRQHRHAAGGAEGAVPRHGAGSAALVRALDAGPAAADPARLGGDAAASAPLGGIHSIHSRSSGRRAAGLGLTAEAAGGGGPMAKRAKQAEAKAASEERHAGRRSGWSDYFGLKEQGTDIRTEFIAG